MKGIFLGVALLVMSVSAGCNLSVNVVSDPPINPTSTRAQPVVEVPTNRVLTATPMTPTITPMPATAAPTCTPRADWPIYKVAVGDTLGQIAVRSGTSTAELIQANCLTNANLLSVGQSIRVPRQPTPPTAKPPTVTPSVQNMGSISVSPSITGDAGNLLLNSGTTITIKWNGGPADAIRTDFFTRTTNGSTSLIASDNSTVDGLSATWTAQANFTGTLTASAIRADGTHIEPYFAPSIYVKDVYDPSNAITLNTYLRVDSDTYFVRPNQPTVLTWTGMPHTTQRVDFKFSPADHTKEPYVLGSDNNLADGLATIIVSFNMGDMGIISSEAYNNDVRTTFAKPVTISVVMPPPEATAEATAQTQ